MLLKTLCIKAYRGYVLWPLNIIYTTHILFSASTGRTRVIETFIQTNIIYYRELAQAKFIKF